MSRLEVLFIMQKLFLVALCITACASAPSLSDAQLDSILRDRPAMERHLRCALGQGPCDMIGRRIKALAPLVLRGSCKHCSPHEDYQIRRTLAFIQRHHPREWAMFIRQHG